MRWSGMFGFGALRPAMVLAALMLAACDGLQEDAGWDLPLHVPGAAVRTLQLAAPPAETDPNAPYQVTAVEFASAFATPGAAERPLTGRATEDAWSVALQLAGSDRAWVLPLEGEDSQFPGERGFAVSLDVGHSASPGLRELYVAALGPTGVPGPTRSAKLCITQPFPDNLNACLPARLPPPVVVELSWDRAADVDLLLRAADGTLVGGKAAGALDASKAPVPVTVDLDGVSDCRDTRQREHAVFADGPALAASLQAGWSIQTRVHDACTQLAIRVRARVIERRPGSSPGTWQQVVTAEYHTTWLAAQAGSATQPLTLGALDVDVTALGEPPAP